jgi:hypothetical protein
LQLEAIAVSQQVSQPEPAALSEMIFLVAFAEV